MNLLTYIHTHNLTVEPKKTFTVEIRMEKESLYTSIVMLKNLELTSKWTKEAILLAPGAAW